MKNAISTFVVNSILEHGGNRKQLGSLFFKTRWLGYDETFDLWLPWHELRDNTQLHKYLRENGLEGIVPKEHRMPRAPRVAQEQASSKPAKQAKKREAPETAAPVPTRRSTRK